MKRQGPRDTARVPVVGKVASIAMSKAAQQLSTAFADMPMTAYAALESLKPLDDGQLHASGQEALVEHVRRTFFRGPSPGGNAAERASRPREPATTALVANDGMAVYRERSSGLLQVLHHEIVLQFRPGIDLAERRRFLADHALIPKYNARLGGTQLVVHPRDPECRGDALIAFADTLDRDPTLVFAAPDFISQFSRGARGAALGAPSAAQWHLALIGAREAWVQTPGTPAVTIAILDDGIDVDHPELSPNIHRRPARGEKRDLCGRDFTLGPRAAGHYDPRPKAFDDADGDTLWNDIHGTACAGVAAGTGPRAHGLAPRCRLLPVKIFRALPRGLDPHGEHAMARDSDVAAAIRYAALVAGADILSCAWTGPDRLAQALTPAFRDARTQGRKGKGTIVVCAAGNHAQRRVAYPASDANVIAVGASTDADTLARYSNTGAEVCVVAPSDGGKRAIFTTDVSSPGRGYNAGRGADALFCDTFGGTSAATSLVAGLCGLLLSLKPAMTPDDVRAILTSTAKKIGPASAYKPNGHSTRYGYGRIDAAKAVAAAQAWTPAPKAPASRKAAAKKTAAKRRTSPKKD